MTDTTTNTRHANMAAALAAFQATIPSVHKGKTARIPGRDGRTGYSYNYADLADVALAAYPALSEHGLSFTARPQHVEGVGFVLVGVLRHESGETDEGMLPIVGRDAQAIGSALTYNRRYLLGCMTGLVTDEDDDGSRAAAARTDRPASEQHGDPDAYRQQGTTQSPAPDHAAVAALASAATAATNEETLRSVWNNAREQGCLNQYVPGLDSTAEPVTLSDFITARKSDFDEAATA